MMPLLTAIALQTRMYCYGRAIPKWNIVVKQNKKKHHKQNIKNLIQQLQQIDKTWKTCDIFPQASCLAAL